MNTEELLLLTILLMGAFIVLTAIVPIAIIALCASGIATVKLWRRMSEGE